MDRIQARKEELRKSIAIEKQKYTQEQLLSMSDEVWSVFEITGVFRDAKTVFIYNSMPDEVSTKVFIDKWIDVKKIYVPVVAPNGLVFRRLDNTTRFEKSVYGIEEPLGTDFVNYDEVDLVIVPGVAFDRKLNRLGRGKAYYDTFLPKISAPKMGVCFDFQLVDTVPTNGNDVAMDYVISENDLIWK